MDKIITVVLVVLVFAIAIFTLNRESKKKSEYDSNTFKPTKKKLNKIIQTKTFKIEGMSCQKCANKILERLDKIEGISAIVEYKKGFAKIQYGKKIDDKYIIEAIEKAGYKVI